ncbi:MAG: hypothetical protein K0A99_03305, partial [Desulfoarculaceae bacterium]|nr:hypothetical protein [Desulfoarculaceae bacterium]
VVKLFCANGTAWVTVWESRTPPNFLYEKPQSESLIGAFLRSSDKRHEKISCNSRFFFWPFPAMFLPFLDRVVNFV